MFIIFYRMSTQSFEGGVIHIDSEAFESLPPRRRWRPHRASRVTARRSPDRPACQAFEFAHIVESVVVVVVNCLRVLVCLPYRRYEQRLRCKLCFN
jgi:hypothetical protein